ncbi:MAG: type II secretion system F family protein, partial [Planctomycetota bacterium]
GNTRRILWEVMTYPLIIGILALTIVSGFMMLVVAQFEEIFYDWGTQLPYLTVLLINISHHYPLILLIAVSILAAVIITWYLLKFSILGRRIRESIVLMIPVIGRVHRTSLIARFLRSVSTSVATGIQLPQAMRLGADATGSTLLINDAEYLASEVEQGQSIFVANQSARIVPPLFGYCVQVAVGREELPSTIGKLARSYENRAIHTQAMLRVILAPVLIIILGGFMFFGIGGMFLPLVSLVNAVSG